MKLSTLCPGGHFSHRWQYSSVLPQMNGPHRVTHITLYFFIFIFSNLIFYFRRPNLSSPRDMAGRERERTWDFTWNLWLASKIEAVYLLHTCGHSKKPYMTLYAASAKYYFSFILDRIIYTLPGLAYILHQRHIHSVDIIILHVCLLCFQKTGENKGWVLLHSVPPLGTYK